MNPAIARKISYSGDEKYAWSFTALACSLFDIFVRNAVLSGNKSSQSTFSIDSRSYVRMSLNGTSGNVHIHAERHAPIRVVDIELTRVDVTCHWNKKPFYIEEYNSHTGLWFQTMNIYPALFHGHGFEMIAFGISNWKFMVLSNYVYGEKIVCRENDIDVVDTDFFEDDFYQNKTPFHLLSGAYANSTLRSGWDFSLITKRIWSHRGILKNTTNESLAWYYSTISIDGKVPVAPGLIDGLPVQTPLVISSGNTTLFRKSRTKFLYHGIDALDEKQDVATGEVICGLSNGYRLPGYTANAGSSNEETRYGATIFCGNEDFSAYAPSSLQELIGRDIVGYLQGSTTVGSLIFSQNGIYTDPGQPELDGRYYDHFWFSTINSAVIHIKSISEDGVLLEFSADVITSKTIQYPEYQLGPAHDTYYRYIRSIAAQSGATVRDLGGTYGCCLYDAHVIGGNRNCAVITDYEYKPHLQFDYNFIINDGGGFAAHFVSGANAQAIAHARSWASAALAFVHNYGCPFNFAYAQNNMSNPVVTLFSGYFSLHTDSKQKEMRFFASKNYKWFVLYNAVDSLGADVSGVYEFTGSAVVRRGDATGVEPVEFAFDESYLLMQDAAYGDITGSFDRLVGFFYDRHHYLEMQSRPEDHLKRFVVKNLDGEVIKQTEFGAYSFYETAADGSMSIISHCAINGVNQSSGGGVMLAVNFTDGPFEFETLCHAMVYNFSLGIEDGYSLNFQHAPELGSPYYGPPNNEPPYGRKNISICHCTENVGGTNVRHRHHVMVSPASGYVIGDSYCMHRPGFRHQRVSNVSVRTLYRMAKQQRGLDPLVESQVITLLALPHGHFYERITDEVGPVDPKLITSDEYVSDKITIIEQ